MAQIHQTPEYHISECAARDAESNGARCYENTIRPRALKSKKNTGSEGRRALAPRFVGWKWGFGPTRAAPVTVRQRARSAVATRRSRNGLRTGGALLVAQIIRSYINGLVAEQE